MSNFLDRAKKIIVSFAALFFASAGITRADVKNINLQDLQALLKDAKEDVFILDVRTPGEYSSGRIPGAVSIPMMDVSSRVDEIPKDKKVVVVCASGGRSARVANFLDKEGFPWIANYVGGTNEWVRKGLTVEK